jgi:hypothetical protein
MKGDADFGAVNANALERLHGYISSPQEPRATVQGKPPAHWPATGDLRVGNLTARYSAVSKPSSSSLFSYRSSSRTDRPFSRISRSTSSRVSVWASVGAHLLGCALLEKLI